MSRRPHNPAPPGRPGPVRRDRPPGPGQRSNERPPVWPDVVDTVMLAKFTRQSDAQLPDQAEPSAPPDAPDTPGEGTRVLRLPGGKHGSAPMPFAPPTRPRTRWGRPLPVAL